MTKNRDRTTGTEPSSPFDSFLAAAAEYIEFVAALRWPSQPDKLQAERELLEQLRDESTNNLAADLGARCFEFVRQLVYVESEQQVAELCRLRNEQLREERTYALSRDGWTKSQRREAFLVMYDSLPDIKVERRVILAITRLKEKLNLDVSRAAGFGYLRNRRADQSQHISEH